MQLIELDKKLFLYFYCISNKNICLKKFSIYYTKFCNILYPALYLFLIVYLYLNRFLEIKVIVIPLTIYVLLKIIRILVKRKRPYLIFPTLMLPQKNKYSLPSNHTGASFIISYTFLYFSLSIGFCLILSSTILALCRVLDGLHFPLDIFSGFLLATIGYIFFYIL